MPSDPVLPTAENDATLTEREREGLVEAIQAGDEVRYVESLIAARLAGVIPPGEGQADD